MTVQSNERSLFYPRWKCWPSHTFIIVWCVRMGLHTCVCMCTNVHACVPERKKCWAIMSPKPITYNMVICCNYAILKRFLPIIRSLSGVQHICIEWWTVFSESCKVKMKSKEAVFLLFASSLSCDCILHSIRKNLSRDSCVAYGIFHFKNNMRLLLQHTLVRMK